MKTRRHWLTMVISIVVIASLGPKIWCSDKKAVLEEVNRKYYNLKANGLTELSCKVVPDFDTANKDLKMDTIGKEQVLPTAKKVRLQVVVGPSGAASVSHQFGEAPPSDEVAGRLRQVTEGIDQMVGGFFQTWSQLMINSPLPGSQDEYQMEDLPDGYRFTTDEGKIHVAVSMNHALHPRFMDGKNGLVLESYQGVYKSTSTNSQELSIKVTYQEIEGLSLRQTVTLTMTLPQGQMEAPIAFRDCQVKKK